MDELAKFEAFSGMQVNKQKSAVFLAAIDDSVRDAILDMTGFRLGSFPIKYLGVPLISSKLSHSDYQPFLDKIIARIQSWTSSSLSFAGRLQLISSVLYSIQAYCCTMFIIPNSGCGWLYFAQVMGLVLVCITHARDVGLVVFGLVCVISFGLIHWLAVFSY